MAALLPLHILLFQQIFSNTVYVVEFGNKFISLWPPPNKNVWYTVRTSINVTKYPQYNNNMIIKNKLRMKWVISKLNPQI
jgi:hypothetical protein